MCSLANPPTRPSQVYDVLTPLVVAAPDPIPLSTFTQKCCDLLLPLLERQQELGPHEFKSQVRPGAGRAGAGSAGCCCGRGVAAGEGGAGCSGRGDGRGWLAEPAWGQAVCDGVGQAGRGEFMAGAQLLPAVVARGARGRAVGGTTPRHTFWHACLKPRSNMSESEKGRTAAWFQLTLAPPGCLACSGDG